MITLLCLFITACWGGLHQPMPEAEGLIWGRFFIMEIGLELIIGILCIKGVFND